MDTQEFQLQLFATMPVAYPFVVRVSVVRDSGVLRCRFEVTGRGVKVPPPSVAGPSRCDGLWRHTCLEVFVTAARDPGYCEWNLSPSGDWNLYRFDNHRKGGRPETAVADARPQVARRDGALVVEADLPLAPLGLADASLEIGLSAVLEADDGTLTYWALAHAAARPDFHDRRGFKLRLPPPLESP